MGEVPRYSGGDWRVNAQIPQQFILPHFAETGQAHEEPFMRKTRWQIRPLFIDI
jgi:hypothetical protein